MEGASERFSITLINKYLLRTITEIVEQEGGSGKAAVVSRPAQLRPRAAPVSLQELPCFGVSAASVGMCGESLLAWGPLGQRSQHPLCGVCEGGRGGCAEPAMWAWLPPVRCCFWVLVQEELCVRLSSRSDLTPCSPPHLLLPLLLFLFLFGFFLLVFWPQVPRTLPCPSEPAWTDTGAHTASPHVRLV